jgi:hypothetical protein
VKDLSEHMIKIINCFVSTLELPSKLCTYDTVDSDNLILSKESVLIIVEGTVLLKRKKDHILFGPLHGPYVLKLCDIDLGADFSLASGSKFSYILYNRCDFFSHISRHNLWENVFHILSYSHASMYRRFDLMVQGGLYASVRYYLHQINESPELKKTTNICNYIVQRSGYSRSGVMATLKELRTGGYIETINGRLKVVNTLPLKF